MTHVQIVHRAPYGSSVLLQQRLRSRGERVGVELQLHLREQGQVTGRRCNEMRRHCSCCIIARVGCLRHLAALEPGVAGSAVHGSRDRRTIYGRSNAKPVRQADDGRPLRAPGASRFFGTCRQCAIICRRRDVLWQLQLIPGVATLRY